MKKILLLILAIIITVSFVACSGADNKIDKSISEIRLNLYEGRSDIFDVSIFIGKRENPYHVDGISENLTNYCLISVTPAEQLADGEELKFTLNGGAYNTSGILKEDKSTGKYRVDIGNYYAEVSEINITFTAGEITDTVIVKSRHTTDMLSWKDALNIARETLAESFNSALSGDEFCGEIFIRFVNNPLMGEDKYFWFIMLKDRNGKLSSVLIDSVSKEVVTKNIL